MATFKEAAYKVLEEEKQPLRTKQIVALAKERGYLATEGATPERTMDAILGRDIKKGKSLFDKTGKREFRINPALKRAERELLVEEESRKTKDSVFSADKKGISTVGKGAIVEGRVVELVSLYSSHLQPLVCYRPVADDEGIDIVVKERYESHAMFLQVKGCWLRDDGNGRAVATVKADALRRMGDKLAVVFCLFDKSKGNIEKMWFVPAPDLCKLKETRKGLFTFTPGEKKGGKWRDSGKWQHCLLPENKDALADRIIRHIKPTGAM